MAKPPGTEPPRRRALSRKNVMTRLLRPPSPECKKSLAGYEVFWLSLSLLLCGCTSLPASNRPSLPPELAQALPALGVFLQCEREIEQQLTPAPACERLPKGLK